MVECIGARGNMSNKMIGLYTIWPDFDYIDKAIQAGINTLLVPFYNLPGKPYDGWYFDTYETSLSVLQRYKGTGVKLIACPVLYPGWYDVDKDDRFVSGGTEYKNHFCPISTNHIETFIAPFRDLFIQGLCHEVIWDAEHYTGKPKMFDQKIRCECQRCNGLSFKDQWEIRASNIKNDKFITGQFPYNSAWSMNCFDGNGKMLTEDTYNGEGNLQTRLKLWGARFVDTWKNDCPKYSIVPGAFMEIFKTPDLFLKYLKYLKTHFPYDGYWIYSQKMMSKNSRIPQSEIQAISNGGFYEMRLVDEVDPNFFQKLKEINK
jgi:hypothetical protein